LKKKKTSKRVNQNPDVVGYDFPDNFDPSTVEKRIVPVIDEPVYLRLLAYGDPGTEKTRLLASAVKSINPLTGKKYRVLILDCNEKGTLSVRTFDPTGKYLMSFKVRGVQDIEDIFWYIKSNPNKWDIIGIDTTTELQWLTIRGVIHDEAKSDSTIDLLMPRQRDYGKTGEIMRMWISNFRNLPCHVIFTSHERTEDEDEQSTKWPDMQNAVKNRLCGAVDIIGRTYHREYKGKMTACLYVGPHETWVTKDRSGVLPDEIKRPDLAKIIEAVQTSKPLAEAQGKKPKKNKKGDK
jgi:hypothetical protein